MSKKTKYAWTLAASLLLAFLLLVPHHPFRKVSYSTLVLGRDGELLGAKIASDGQWRFPPSDTIPEKYRKALINFEDRWFYWHPGVNPVSALRALEGNIRAGHVTSGGSTITMQLVRMSRGKRRTLWQKVIESAEALRLEASMSKREILAMYAAHAPYGGNVVGLEAASWRYFGHPSSDLSWGEASLLAVLPNSPSGMNPGRNRGELLAKRNRLLDKLLKRSLIDSTDYLLAIDEALPASPHPLPSLSPQLTATLTAVSSRASSRTSLRASSTQTRGSALGTVVSENNGRIVTTIDAHLQERVEAIADRHSDDLAAQGIADLAAVVIDIESGDILAWVGNASPYRSRPGFQVNIADAARSTGSILKPFLYCALLQEGTILPNSLVKDTRINLNGFSPENFDLTFSGAVPASEALARSLNVPAVHMLRDYGVPKFHELLKKAGLTTLSRPSSDYGLSLILGGAEARLGEITAAYAAMAKSYLSNSDTSFVLHDKAALWYTFKALSEVNRPDEIDWHLISSVKKVAWKTGTSYGFRDAWAVGVDTKYAVGVWVGNADGHGVPGLTGARAAGPVLFDIFNALSGGGWFEEPLWGSYITAEVCHESGFLRGASCEDIDTLMLPKAALRSAPCPYHKFVNGKSVFVLPPAMEYYYRQRHPEYTGAEDAGSQQAVMEFIYPEEGSTIYLPRETDGKRGAAVFELAHRSSGETVFWHMDGEYLGETKFIHQLRLSPEPGEHTLTAVDSKGRSLSISFTVSPSKL